MIPGYSPFVLVAVVLGRAGAQEPMIQATVVAQTNYGWTTPAAPGGVEPSLGFVSQTRQLRLTEATFSLIGNWERAGFHVDGGSGDFYRLAMAGDSWKGPNRYISQAYVFGTPFSSLPIRIEAGKFFSSVGAEVPQSVQDFNTSRSLLFWYGSPLYHVGIRASATITSKFTLGAQLLSGCNTTGGAHGHQTATFTTAWTGKHWSWSQLYMGGNEKPVGRGWRHLSDAVITVSPFRKVAGYIELLAAVETRVGSSSDRWYGVATAWQVSPREQWRFSPRLEWYNDVTGATTGHVQRLKELTFTAEYRPRKWFIARMEYRSDWTNRSYTHEDYRQDTRRKETMIAGITLLLSHGWNPKPKDSTAAPAMAGARKGAGFPLDDGEFKEF